MKRILSSTSKASDKCKITLDNSAVALYKKRQIKIKSATGRLFQLMQLPKAILLVRVSVLSRGDSIHYFRRFWEKKRVNETDVVSGKTIFRLGSLSKGFTGVLAASLQADNSWNLNDKVIDYLPKFQLGSIVTTPKKLPLAHILSHSSGTPYHSYTNLVEAGIPIETIATKFDQVDPISEPGREL